jgi:hypothetical protein
MTVWLAEKTTTTTSPSSTSSDEKTLRIYRELREGLMKHKRTLWEQEMQEHVKLMMGALKINELHIHTFLAILGSLSKFIAIAEEFGGTMAHTLRETFREHSKVFFAQFHRTRLEQVKEMIEKESWTPLGLKKGFGLKNFKELQEIVMATMPQQRAYKRRKQSFFEGYSVQGNPFAADTDGMDMDEINFAGDRKAKKEIARYKWEEAGGSELLVDFVDELGSTSSSSSAAKVMKSPMTGRATSRSGNASASSSSSQSSKPSLNPVTSGAPIISEVTNQIVTIIGEYMHLMQLLPHYTSVVFDGLVQVVEYFLWSIHSFFAVCKPTLSNGDRNLAITLRRIQSDLLLDTQTHEALLAAAQAAQVALQNQGLTAGFASTTSSMLSGIKDTFSLSRDSSSSSPILPPVPAGVLSPGGTFYKGEASASPTQVKMVRPKVPIGLTSGSMQQQMTQVMVATGSLKFLRQILSELQPNFIELLGRDRLPKVISFAGTLAETTVPLRAAIFRYAPQGLISIDKMVSTVASGNWDSLDEDVKESQYVKPLVKEVSSYIEKLKAMVKQSLLPAEILPEMVLQSLSFAMEVCVEGYSKARRVTTEGHNIMLYDMQEVKNGLQSAAGIRSHDWTFLDEYVHAYHFPVDDLLTFFREHPWYTKSQLQGLVSSGPWNQREKTKLLDALNYHGAFTASASNSQSTSSTNRSRSSSRR